MIHSMAERVSRPPRRPTSTSVFGSGRRESHDSSSFYARFQPPIINNDDRIGPRPQSEGPILGDARRMHQIPDRSVALVVTSPPYFVGKAYENEVLQRTQPGALIAGLPRTYREYLQLLYDAFYECIRVLEPGGRIAVNVANLGRKPYRSLSADVIKIFEDLGLLMRGEIIWRKAKAMGGAVAWGSFRQPSNPVLRDTTERIIVASKGRFDRAKKRTVRKKAGLPNVATLPNDEFVEATLDVWEIPAESARRVSHPAPFPVELPLRLIDLYTYEDDLVLDPFMGSGTTLVAAYKAWRRAVGYDIKPEYVEIAHRRLERARRRPSLLDQDPEPEGAVNGTPQPGGISMARPSIEHFQARAVREGKKVQDLARGALEAAGFTIVKTKPRIPAVGIQYNFLVENQQGKRWYVDVSGAFTTVRPGLQRTDTLWKALGRAHVLRMARLDTPLLILTSNLPKPRSEGWKALKAVSPQSVFDAIEIFNEWDNVRLAHYGREAGVRPIEGYWTQEEIDLAFPG